MGAHFFSTPSRALLGAMEAGRRLLSARPVLFLAALFLFLASVEGHSPDADEVALVTSFEDAYDATSTDGAKAHPPSPKIKSAKDILPITGWTDSLDGVMDSKALCKHLRTELDVARSRFQSNTRRRLEKHYGAAIVTEMSEAYHHKLKQLRKREWRSGCPPKQVGTLLWHDDLERNRSQLCKFLKRRQQKIVLAYQAHVKAMMLRTMPVQFTASVNRLYSVTRSLRARLAEQRCPGSGFGAAVNQLQPQPQSQPQTQYPEATPARTRQQDASALRARIAAASQRITKHTRVVQEMQRSMSSMSQEMAMLTSRMKALRARMSLTREQLGNLNNIKL